MKKKRVPYQAKNHMLSSPLLAKMRSIAYAPVSLSEDSETAEMKILQKSFDKHQRKLERNKKNA